MVSECLHGRNSGHQQCNEPAPLGTTAKSATPPADDREHVRLQRALRYQALSQARHWLRADAQPRIDSGAAEYPGDVYRTTDCRWVSYGDVTINHNAEHQSAFFGGLATCGSVWACPVCAAKIQERRRLEIETAMTAAEAQGLGVTLVTFTFPHQSWHRLPDLIQQQRDAFRRYLRKGSPFRRLRERIGFQGLIRSLEVVHGDNGWHPHTHELWFHRPDVGTCYQVELTRLWERACIRSGLLDPDDQESARAFRVHGVDVRADVDAGDYLAKQDDSRRWGASHEIAKAKSKGGRAKGVHPHHFLIRQGPGDAHRYVEYVQAMKGARQLYWTPGLKERLGVLDTSDEALADEDRETADVLAMLTPDDWALLRSNDARAEALDAAEVGGREAVTALLRSLRGA